jgi:hypothetical protein
MRLLAAWAGHTDASREFSLDIGLSLIAAGMKRREAADLMGITESELSRQLAGVEPLSAWRLANLPTEFWMALWTRRAKRIGAEFLSPEQTALVKGAATLGKRRMAKMFQIVGGRDQERKEA